ncbi:hypothetical protein MP638_005851 [Amoeboaphelidium occidentale]|nr:hypothetical protein MP638_005851 [Amoeboaphelidium occidentale]
MRDLLRKFVGSPSEFTEKDFEESLRSILDDKATPGQIGSFITLLRLHNKEKDPVWIATAARVMASYAVPVKNVELLKDVMIADIVGTGGDGFDTFNASTAAAIVVAGCDVGIVVAKHGNRSSSSKCGSADLLEAAGCHLDNVNSNNLCATLLETGFSFLFAQSYHPALKKIGGIRKELGFYSIFNLMGPLLNPLKPKYMVVGVNSKESGHTVAQALLSLGIERALVVNGAEGLDEISPEGKTNVWEILGSKGSIEEKIISPQDDFGLSPVPVKSVKGGFPKDNALKLEDMLNGTLSQDDPIVQFVCMNASALLNDYGSEKHLYWCFQ